LGCKGITVYVTGSREKVVLETHATASRKKGEETAPESTDQIKIWTETKKPRPRALVGRTYSVETPLGKAFVTINENGGDQPFEVFINTAKAGSDTAAVSEAIGRLISYILRLASPIEPSQRLTDVTRQLAGIGGGRSLGFGPGRSVPYPMAWHRCLKNILMSGHTVRGTGKLHPRTTRSFPLNLFPPRPSKRLLKRKLPPR